MEWAILFIALLVIEIVTVNLVSVWFALGALAAYITAMITGNVFIQLLVFTIVSTISLILTKPFMNKYFKQTGIEKLNTNRVIGKYGVVTKKITKTSDGEVKVDGKLWTAVSNKTISEGTTIVVKELKGIKLVVNIKEEND